MKINDIIIENILDEAVMNPTVFAQAIQQGSEKGVLVGYEFEVCVPAAVFSKPSTGNDTEKKIKRNWEEYLLNITFDTPEEAAATFDRVFKFKEPINGYTSIGDFITKRQAELLPQIRKAFEKIPEKFRAKYIKRARERSAERVNWTNPKPAADSPALQILFANSLGNLIYNNERGHQDEAYYLKSISNRGYSLGGDDILSGMYGKTATSTLMKKFQDNLEYNPADAWATMKEDVYDEDDDYDSDERYDKASPALAKVLKSTMGMPVVVFNDYHQDDKSLSKWYIEPDGSLEADQDADATAEIVSPPLPALQAMADLKKFYSMAEQLGLYTNSSTGLHINISIPGDLDVLKLAVFLGDKYVLQQYGRSDSYYAQSVGKQLDPNKLGAQTKLMNKMHDTNKVDQAMLGKIIGDFASQHTASISYNGTYVSFRHAGGNYLADFNKVYNTVGRFIRAMIIASTPGAYEREYQTELAKYGIAAQATRGLDSKAKLVAADTMIKYIRSNGIPTTEIIAMIAPDRSAAELSKYIKRFFSIITTNTSVNQRPGTAQDQQLVLDRIQQPNNKELVTTGGWKPVVLTVTPTTSKEIQKFAAYTSDGSVLRAGPMHDAWGFWTTNKGNIPATDPRAQAILKKALMTRYGK